MAKEDVIVFPVFADAETFAETPILVCLREDPRGVHERLTYSHRVRVFRYDPFLCVTSEVSCDLFVPQRNVSFVI